MLVRVNAYLSTVTTPLDTLNAMHIAHHQQDLSDDPHKNSSGSVSEHCQWPHYVVKKGG